LPSARLWLTSTIFITSCAALASEAGQDERCAPAGGLSFLCGAIKPEDLKEIPGTHFLVTSGFSPGSGLKLVDTRAKTFSFWYNGAPEQVALDRSRYPDCVAPPDPALFNARGLSLRRTGVDAAVLHVVNHGGREAIEVFRISNLRARRIWSKPAEIVMIQPSDDGVRCASIPNFFRPACG
jgi:hypothetical protein